VLNLVWLVLHGWVLALAYLLAGALACLTVVGIPFGIAAFRLASFVVLPFGRTTVADPRAGLASALGNLAWFVVAGWWLALVHVLAGIAFCLRSSASRSASPRSSWPWWGCSRSASGWSRPGRRTPGSAPAERWPREGGRAGVSA